MFTGVIGATGQIGQRVITEELARDHRVTAFGRKSGRADTAPTLTSSR
jgi:putative NADH-flavin reductase